MDPMTFATLALQMVPLLIRAGEDVIPFVEQAITALRQTSGPTKDDWDKLHANEDRLRAILDGAGGTSAGPSSGAPTKTG